MNTQTKIIESDEVQATVFFQENKETLESCINAALNIHDPYDKDQVTVIIPCETSSDYFAILPTKNILIVPYWSDEHSRLFHRFVNYLPETPNEIANDGSIAIGKHHLQVLKFDDIMEYKMAESFKRIEEILEKYENIK